MIQHVVLLSWNDTITEAAVETLTEGFGKLPSQIPEISSYRFGPDLGFNDRNADYVLVAEFEGRDDFETYAAHPAHQELMATLIGPYLDSYRTVQFDPD